MALGNLKKCWRAAAVILILSLSVLSGVSSGGRSEKGSQAISPENSLHLMEYEQLMSLSKEDLGVYLTGIKLMLVDWEKSQTAHQPDLVAGNTSEQFKFLNRAFSTLVAETLWAEEKPTVKKPLAPATPVKPVAPVKPAAAVKPAAPVTQFCIYAGWINATDEKGYCKRPPPCEDKKDSVQCHPLLFGKGTCVSVETKEDRAKATVTCFEKSKSTSEIVDYIKSNIGWNSFYQSFKTSSAPCVKPGAPPYCEALKKRIQELNTLLPPTAAVAESKPVPPVIEKSKGEVTKDKVKKDIAPKAVSGRASVDRRDKVAAARGARTRTVSGPTRKATPVVADTADPGGDDEAPGEGEEMEPDAAADPSLRGESRDGSRNVRERAADDGKPQDGSECRPQSLDFDASFPDSEEPSPVLTFEQAQDLFCKSKFDQKVVDSRLEFLRKQIADFNVKSRAETDYYHRLWTQLKENLVACVALVKKRGSGGAEPSRAMSFQYRVDFGGGPAGVLTSSKRGGKIGRNKDLDRVYVDRDSLGATIHANGIQDICSVEVLSGSSGVPANRPPGVSR